MLYEVESYPLYQVNVAQKHRRSLALGKRQANKALSLNSKVLTAMEVLHLHTLSLIMYFIIAIRKDWTLLDLLKDFMITE